MEMFFQREFTQFFLVLRISELFETEYSVGTEGGAIYMQERRDTECLANTQCLCFFAILTHSPTRMGIRKLFETAYRTRPEPKIIPPKMHLFLF